MTSFYPNSLKPYLQISHILRVRTLIYELGDMILPKHSAFYVFFHEVMSLQSVTTLSRAHHLPALGKLVQFCHLAFDQFYSCYYWKECSMFIGPQIYRHLHIQLIHNLKVFFLV